jgi:hypothetical protein
MFVIKFEHVLFNIANLRDKTSMHSQLELQVFRKKCHLTPPLWVDGSQTPYQDKMKKKAIGSHMVFNSSSLFMSISNLIWLYNMDMIMCFFMSM